jgi:hypothetical protein
VTRWAAASEHYARRNVKQRLHVLDILRLRIAKLNPVRFVFGELVDSNYKSIRLPIRVSRLAQFGKNF